MTIAIKERYLWYVKKFLEDLTIDIQKPDNMPELEFKTKSQQIVTKKVTNQANKMFIKVLVRSIRATSRKTDRVKREKRYLWVFLSIIGRAWIGQLASA